MAIAAVFRYRRIALAIVAATVLLAALLASASPGRTGAPHRESIFPPVLHTVDGVRPGLHAGRPCQARHPRDPARCPATADLA